MNVACGRLGLAGDQPQQRGFAAAVASDKASPLAPQRQRQAVKEGASVRRGEGNGVQDNRWHGELPEWIGIAARTAGRNPLRAPWGWRTRTSYIEIRGPRRNR